MLQNSALDNLGEQAENSEEGEQGPRNRNIQTMLSDKVRLALL